MASNDTDYGLEFLLSFDGRGFRLDGDYWVSFRIRRIEATRERPHGLAYSLSLHARDGRRLLGFDNAHPVRRAGRRRSLSASDHWHRSENDPGRPYAFKDATTLIKDFFDEAERILREHGIAMRIIKIEESGRSE